MKFALNPFIQAFGVVVGIILVAFVLFGKGPSSVTDSNGQIKRGPDIAEIGARADNLPIPVVIDRKNGAGNKTVTVNLKATQVIANRSEERRVGKESRSRWSPYH